MPPPMEWELELKRLGKVHFLCNDKQLHAIKSVRCGYYCLLFPNERNRGFQSILNMFSADARINGELVKNYFLCT